MERSGNIGEGVPGVHSQGIQYCEQASQVCVVLLFENKKNVVNVHETSRIEDFGNADVADDLRQGQVDNLHDVAFDQRRFGPRGALKSLDLAFKSPAEVGAWIERARLAAILGGCRLSVNSLRSGLRCYITFVSKLFA